MRWRIVKEGDEYIAEARAWWFPTWSPLSDEWEVRMRFDSVGAAEAAIDAYNKSRVRTVVKELIL